MKFFLYQGRWPLFFECNKVVYCCGGIDVLNEDNALTRGEWSIFRTDNETIKTRTTSAELKLLYLKYPYYITNILNKQYREALK